MKTIVKSLIGALAISAAGGVNAYLIDEFSAFVGVDYYQAWMKARNSYTQIFPRNSYPGASVYVGTRFQDCFGIEIGFDWSGTKKRDWSLSNGATIFGGTVAGTMTGSSKVKRSGGHLDVIGYLPVCNCFELFGSLGYGWVQSKIHITNIAVNGVLGTPTLQSEALASLSGKGRSVFRLGFGASYLITPCVGIRAKFGWETTSTQRFNGNAAARSLGYGSKGFRDSTTLAVGAFLNF